MHSIHGRAPAIATGIATTRPELSVWVITGDGDALSIGGNHLIHMLRRNVNLKILLFNNQIYGLTKGQYSPTSEVGKATKSIAIRLTGLPVQPGVAWRSVPRRVSWPAPWTWTAITPRTSCRRSTSTKGSAFVEIYQNCNVFNDKAFIQLTGKEERVHNRIDLEHGKPVVFDEGAKAVVLQGWRGPRRRLGLGRSQGDPGPRRDPARPFRGVRPEPSLPWAVRTDATRDLPERQT